MALNAIFVPFKLPKSGKVCNDFKITGVNHGWNHAPEPSGYAGFAKTRKALARATPIISFSLRTPAAGADGLKYQHEQPQGL